MMGDTLQRRGDPQKWQWLSTVPRASVTVPLPPASREGFRNARGCGSLEPCGRGGSGLLPWRVHELREISPFGQVPQSCGGSGLSSGEDCKPSVASFFVRRSDGEGGRFLKSSPARLRGQRRGRFLRPAGARGAGTARSNPAVRGLQEADYIRDFGSRGASQPDYGVATVTGRDRGCGTVRETTAPWPEWCGSRWLMPAAANPQRDVRSGHRSSGPGSRTI